MTVFLNFLEYNRDLFEGGFSLDTTANVKKDHKKWLLGLIAEGEFNSGLEVYNRLVKDYPQYKHLCASSWWDKFKCK